MTTFVALLRAVNVSGKNRIPMAELRRALGGLGLTEVETYLQSGNVVFDAKGDDPAKQADAIHDLIAREFEGDVRVLVLTAAELAQAADEKALHARRFFSRRRTRTASPAASFRRRRVSARSVPGP
jgi:uncharacterized protein (DUF1697 family)